MDLSHLSALEHLSIQTSENMVAEVGNEADEALLVRKWLTGRRQLPLSWEADITHPNLSHIVLRYGSLDMVLSDWSRDTPSPHWSRKIHMAVAEDDCSFLL